MRRMCILIPKTCAGFVQCDGTDSAGKLISLEVNKEQCNLSLIGVYAPFVSCVSEQVSFFQELRRIALDRSIDMGIILCGDFNTHLCELRNNYLPNRANNFFRSLLDECNLVDVWRYLNPETRRYSWRRTNPLQP